ncbi:hypothetical protein LTR53_006302 [Teratosphaeriaceae sp. CCFEE 6253]|nr:hypothetical protein LTR53_006302 [Teratosphaeriaceae sp. CCFEE 6253]
MNFIQAVCTLFAIASIVEARHAQHKHAHQAVEVQRRQVGPPVVASPKTTSESTTSSSVRVLTMITPSPGASPIAVTEQSQLVTSYVPQFTLCELPPLAFLPTTPVPSLKPSTAPYHNYSISTPPGNGTCTTIYSQTATMVCDTTLSGLVTTYPVTNCAQEITFSSRYGYALVTSTSPANGSSNGTSVFATGTATNATALITPAPSIQTLTTYFIAPWQDLTAATAPSDVIRKVCQTFANGTEECITEYQVWHTSLVTSMATSTVTLNISTTIHGPSGVMIWETMVANVTELITTFSMMTTMETEYQTEWTTTSKAMASVSTAPTVFETLTVELASSTDSHTPGVYLSMPSTHLVVSVSISKAQPAGHGLGSAMSKHSLYQRQCNLSDIKVRDWLCTALPLSMVLLSRWGLAALVLPIIMCLVPGADAAAISTNSNGTSSPLPSSQTLTPVAALLDDSGINTSGKGGPICYTPACAYEPVSAAAASVSTLLQAAYLLAFMWIIGGSAPRLFDFVIRASRKDYPIPAKGRAHPCGKSCHPTAAGAGPSQESRSKACGDCRKKAIGDAQKGLGSEADVREEDEAGINWRKARTMRLWMTRLDEE